MAFSVTQPVSEILRSKHEEPVDGDEDGPKTKSREDWRKAKELEEARKAGTAPAAVDEEGRDINPHIPQYIAAAPWYFGSRGPTLKHQRIPTEQNKTYSTQEEWYKRGVDATKVATKFRKGACQNCGAMTHQKKDCMERPRKVGAKFTGDAIAPDEHAQPTLDFDFDGKRDRWNGYDANEYLAIVEDFQKVEEAKRHLKAEKLKTGQEIGDLPDNMVMDEDMPEEDEDKYVDDVDMPGTKVDSKQRITVRNLRIREDIAKYLRNLDPNSAYYDPKTRSMRDNPYKDISKVAEQLDFAGENFVRYTGDTRKHAAAQLFAWEAHDKGVDVHVLAEPTKLELLQKEFVKKKDEFKGSLTKNVIDKYGGERHLDAPPKTLLLAQTEDYVEYSRQGKVIKGNEKPNVKSKYEEDAFPNNHNSVFGSYWRAGQWGYKCCHSLIKNSYCTGEAGKQSNDSTEVPHVFKYDDEEEEVPQASKEKIEETSQPETEAPKDEKPVAGGSGTKSKSKNKKKNEKRRERRKRKAKKRVASSSSSSSSEDSSSSSSSDSDSNSDDEDKKKKKRLAKALLKEEQRQKDAENMADDRKRAYHSLYDNAAPTEEELEAYYMRRNREEDPMLQFLSKPKKQKRN